MFTSSHSPSRRAVLAGRTISGLVIAFLFLDAAMKLVPFQPVIDAMTTLGFDFSPALARMLGSLLLLCTVIHVIPRTRLLGAILLTGFLGGAMAIQMRAGNPLFTHILFGGYLCLLLWVGLLLRSPDLRVTLFKGAR